MFVARGSRPPNPHAADQKENTDNALVGEHKVESVEMGTKATTKVVGCGNITLKIQCGPSFQIGKFENVLHIPSFEYSLLPVSALDKKGIQTTFDDCK